jgi:hypothetical protein
MRGGSIPHLRALEAESILIEESQLFIEACYACYGSMAAVGVG